MTGPPRVVGADELFEAISYDAAIDALENAFLDPSRFETPDRSHLDLGGSDLLVMPSWGASAAGVKLVTVTPANPDRGLPLISGVYALFERPTMAPVAIIDAAALTVLRTAAVSALATRHLAAHDAETLVVFGAGAQAGGHVRALARVRPFTAVVVVSRTRARAEALATELEREDLPVRVGEPDDVEGADVICTCTTSSTPVFPGALVSDGAHVNAVGSYKPHAREVDDELVRRAAIVVEDRDAALAEAGDLIQPLAAGTISTGGIAELAEVVRGRWARPLGAPTLFKSVGRAFEDLAVAALVPPLFQ